MFFYREQSRLVIDFILERAADLTVIEIKSAGPTPCRESVPVAAA